MEFPTRSPLLLPGWEGLEGLTTAPHMHGVWGLITAGRLVKSWLSRTPTQAGRVPDYRWVGTKGLAPPWRSRILPLLKGLGYPTTAGVNWKWRLSTAFAGAGRGGATALPVVFGGSRAITVSSFLREQAPTGAFCPKLSFLCCQPLQLQVKGKENLKGSSLCCFLGPEVPSWSIFFSPSSRVLLCLFI